MIIFLIVLGSIAALITALMLISVGVYAAYRNDGFYFAVTIAGIAIPLGGGVGKKRKPKKAEEKKAPAKAKKEKKERQFPPVNKLLPIIFDVLDKLRKSVTIKHLEVNYRVGGDPFAAAMTCGLITETVGFLTPLASKVLKIKYSRILVMPNFASGEHEITFKARVSVHIGSIVRIALSALIQFIKARKENQNGQTSSGRSDGSDNAENPRDGRREYHRGNSHTDA